MKAPRHTWALGLTVGPLFAWLCWSVQRKRPGHIVAAVLANLILWTAGPALIGAVLA